MVCRIEKKRKIEALNGKIRRGNLDPYICDEGNFVLIFGCKKGTDKEVFGYLVFCIIEYSKRQEKKSEDLSLILFLKIERLCFLLFWKR